MRNKMTNFNLKIGKICKDPAMAATEENKKVVDSREKHPIGFITTVSLQRHFVLLLFLVILFVLTRFEFSPRFYFYKYTVA